MYLEELKLMLGDAASNYTDAYITLAYKMALAEVETYCRRKPDIELEIVARKIAVIHLLRSGTEGLNGQSFGGVNETYTDGYSADIMAILNSKRKVKSL